jgi:hypothetical protein
MVRCGKAILVVPTPPGRKCCVSATFGLLLRRKEAARAIGHGAVATRAEGQAGRDYLGSSRTRFLNYETSEIYAQNYYPTRGLHWFDTVAGPV